MYNNRAAYFLLAPAIAFLIIFSLLPVLMVIALSLFKTNYMTWKFVGIGNYLKIIKGSYGPIIINSFLYVIIIVIGCNGFGLFICLLIVNMNKWLQDAVRFVFYIPCFTVGIIISLVWKWIFNPSTGVMNYIIGLVGFEPIIWFGNRFTAIIAVSLSIIIVGMGTNLIIYLSAVLSIDKSIYDSALIDGASWNQIKMKIIIPIIAPTIYILTLFGVIGGFQMWETIFILSPITTAYNLMYDSYSTAFRFSHYGLGSAKSITLMIIIFIVAIIKQKAEREREI